MNVQKLKDTFPVSFFLSLTIGSFILWAGFTIVTLLNLSPFAYYIGGAFFMLLIVRIIRRIITVYGDPFP